MKEQLTLIATCPMGLEAVVAREVKELGYSEVTVENGKVRWQGDRLAICRANLWLRTADRILIQMGRFEAQTFEELFEGTKALAWADWIPEDGTFPVNGRSHQSQLSSEPACQAIVKKAIVESLKQHYETEWFQEQAETYVIEVSLLNNIATLTLDTTGPSLHKRGYRKWVTEAPLKETMAAAMILLSRWTPDRPLYDPFCGSGTIPIEAAMIGWNVAPGLRRTFDAEAWPAVPLSLWDEAREEAYDLVRDDIPLEIGGSDIDQKAIDVALAAAKAAGLAKELSLQVLPVARAKPLGDYGCVITNPPYGERIGEKAEVERALRQLGLLVVERPNWSAFVLSPNKDMDVFMGKVASKRRKLFNGRIECQLYQYFAPGGLFAKQKADRTDK